MFFLYKWTSSRELSTIPSPFVTSVDEFPQLSHLQVGLKSQRRVPPSSTSLSLKIGQLVCPKWGFRRKVFQPSIFRFELLNLGGVFRCHHVAQKFPSQTAGTQENTDAVAALRRTVAKLAATWYGGSGSKVLFMRTLAVGYRKLSTIECTSHLWKFHVCLFLNLSSFVQLQSCSCGSLYMIHLGFFAAGAKGQWRTANETTWNESALGQMTNLMFSFTLCSMLVTIKRHSKNAFSMWNAILCPSDMTEYESYRL